MPSAGAKLAAENPGSRVWESEVEVLRGGKVLRSRDTNFSPLITGTGHESLRLYRSLPI